MKLLTMVLLIVFLTSCTPKAEEEIIFSTCTEVADKPAQVADKPVQVVYDKPVQVTDNNDPFLAELNRAIKDFENAPWYVDEMPSRHEPEFFDFDSLEIERYACTLREGCKCGKITCPQGSLCEDTGCL